MHPTNAQYRVAIFSLGISDYPVHFFLAGKDASVMDYLDPAKTHEIVNLRI